MCDKHWRFHPRRESRTIAATFMKRTYCFKPRRLLNLHQIHKPNNKFREIAYNRLLFKGRLVSHGVSLFRVDTVSESVLSSDHFEEKLQYLNVSHGFNNIFTPGVDAV